ncbi:MAG: ribonuclease T [Pseudomonadales bacterium]|nr:ribonuclease T [Pseudomonadales bacterium]
MKTRFRGYLPVVVDLETGGFDDTVHSLLEIAAVTLNFEHQRLVASGRHRWAVTPHPDTAVEEASLRVTGIDLNDPARGAVPEHEAVRGLFRVVRAEVKRHGCQRAIVTAHNAHFDHGFIHAAATRSGIKRSPFHPFSVVDTVGLAAVHYGHTVLSEACGRAGIDYDADRAHSAAYDAEITAALFCAVVNATVQRKGAPGGPASFR